MCCLVVIYDECVSYNCVSNLWIDVLRHETLTFLELFFMYKSSLHITCLIKCLNQLFQPFFCSLHLCNLKKWLGCGMGIYTCANIQNFF